MVFYVCRKRGASRETAMPTVSIKGNKLEPTSTGTSAAGLAVWKAMGGIAGWAPLVLAWPRWW